MSGQAGKKGKKKAKTKTVSLNDFLSDSPGPGVVKQLDWADEADSEYRSVNSSLTYQSTSAPKTIQLPTAPRASRTIEIDHTRIPENGPFTAFVGNLPYEVNQQVLEDFFNGLTIVNVRLPEENGRFKGFGYVQFADRQSLIKALEMNEESLQKRNIRIDIADNQGNKEGGSTWGRSGDRYNRENSGPDPTEGNWRQSQPDERPTDFQSRQASYRGDDYDSGNRYRKSSRDYDNYDRRGSDRQGGYGQRSYDDRGGFDRSRGYDDRNRGYEDRSGYSRNQSYDRPRFGNRGYDRPRQDAGGYGRENEPPRERAPLRLQPRQKPLSEESSTPSRSSSIFGSAKPVDTASKERVIEEKLFMQQKSQEETKPVEKKTNIFGDAKPVDTTKREREIEEKIVAVQNERKVAPKQPSVSARSSIFGDAKPVDTTAREREIEDKLRKQRAESSSSTSIDERSTERRSRMSSQRSDDHSTISPRRSRTSSARSSEDQHDGNSSSQKSSEGGKEAAKPQFKPAPLPKENAWGKKSFPADRPVAAAKQNPPVGKSAPPNAWNKATPKTDQRGEREEAEGSREDDAEERMPEGAADEEVLPVSRGQPGDGSETNERSYPARRDVPRYKSDRNNDDRVRNAKYDSNRYGPGTNQQRNRIHNDGTGYRDNRRRGDGDSHSYRGGAGYGNNSARNRRDGGGKTRQRNDHHEKRRDSSRDSRPECDRSDGAGQEQPSSSNVKASKAKPKPKQAEKEQPVDFVTQSKFAVLSMTDSDNEVDVE